MSLNKQIHIYSVDTSAFYNDEEMKIHKRLSALYTYRKLLIKKRDKYKHPNKKYTKYIDNIKELITITSREIKHTKDKIYLEFKKNESIRQLRREALYIKDKKTKQEIRNLYNIISVFESSLTRIIGIPENELSEDLIVVQTYFFEIVESIIKKGFYFEDEKYICLTASAGQIRTKKTVFIKEEVWNKYQNTITCGLTIEDINKKGGVNINKYLAYLALCNSATDLWEDFDISKTIVVEDFETLVESKVDMIDDKTYKIESGTTVNVPITHTDGCGIILPRKSNKSMMVRLPWVKGLLVPFCFDDFIKQANDNSTDKTINYGIIKDIYGDSHDIIKEGIEVIFTKSQFKMWKYYVNWNEYKDKYNIFQCQAGKCNEEEDIIKDAKINYQMLQTLSEMTDDEILILCERTKKDITNIGKDKKTMLKVLGVTKQNNNKNYIQQALEIYPELLSDTYSKEILKQVKKSIVTDARAGKVRIEGKYTFLCPDLYAFCEYLFLGNKNPRGLLENGQVYCNLYKEVKELDCLRSPHLYREHAVRENIIDEIKDEWFISKGVYTSCHDVISKILQFDNDGDKSLVAAEKTLVNVAKRHMENILPLYYNMRKAEPVLVNNDSIYEGLKTAYTGGNIGAISNDITKIWNSGDINLDVIKLLCMENNFTIDYAKTLYKPERPAEIKKLITKYTKAKTPHFFIYAKDKEKVQVEPINNSVVNRISKIINNPAIKFNAELGKFDYKMLMNNKDIVLDKTDQEIIKLYTKLDLRNHFMLNKNDDNDKVKNITYLYQSIRKQILEINNDINYVVDVLVKYLYEVKNSSYKTTLWECFGDIIVQNIKRNLIYGFKKKAKHCEKCGKLIEFTTGNKLYCNECAKEIKREKDRKRMEEKRKNK